MSVISSERTKEDILETQKIKDLEDYKKRMAFEKEQIAENLKRKQAEEDESMKANEEGYGKKAYKDI